jgi:hypothetical protein
MSAVAGAEPLLEPAHQFRELRDGAGRDPRPEALAAIAGQPVLVPEPGADEPPLLETLVGAAVMGDLVAK